MTSPSVLQATAWYPPHSLGGTEVYLEGLVAELATIGIGSTVIVPRHKLGAGAYQHAGTRVETYPVNERPTTSELKGRAPHAGFDEFRKRLLHHRTAIYHQHAWTRGCGPMHLRAARELGMRTVLTVHVPGATCLRGTMLKFGLVPCEGRIEPATCGACWAEARGLPRTLARGVGGLPAAVSRGARLARGRIATALSARALGSERLQQLADMIRNADRIVAVCEWLRDALAGNGVPADKLVLNRQGLSSKDLAALEAQDLGPRPRERLRMLFLGRWDPVKGIDVVVRAVRSLPAEVPVHLTIHAVPAPPAERAYEQEVRSLAAADARISIEAPLPRAGLPAAFARHDVLVVPSISLETGPLVVLEAMAAGLFVLGSRRGGIGELVAEPDAGELVAAGDIAAWARAMARLADRHARDGLLRRPHSVRTMAAAAQQMAELYRSL